VTSESSADETIAGEPGSAAADSHMADVLRGARSRGGLREALRAEGTPESDDVIGRLNALDFVDGLVGEATEMPGRLGDYRITGLLGRGGMGTVYEAFQESLEREVAIKVLSPAFCADVTMRERFRAEARATASLHHEHIVPVYDFGESGGLLYFAMEKVEGVSLDKHIAMARRSGRPVMEPREAARRFAGVAEALFHAHRRGIVHRDVKPGNILVGPDGTLALADFGLSKIVGEVSRQLTAAGAFLGTPSYAPPEQAKGQNASPAGDLYGFGVTMFEALTGELPLSGSTTEALLEAILHGTPKRLRAVLPKAPRDLDAVIDKLLQKEPGDRYADGESLARDLRHIADGEPVRIRRQPIWLRAWRKAKKNPVLTATVSVAVLLALVSFGLALLTRREHLLSVDAQYENRLQDAMIAASRQSGAAQGPPGLLRALIGVDVDVPAAHDEVLEQLAKAEELAPSRDRGSKLRVAYASDPLPAATELLARGAGHGARVLLDPEIEAARKAFERRDDVTLLRLYRLYLMRAVACLMSAEGQLGQARDDLFAASLIRSGAFFPKLLLECVQWQPDQGSTKLLDRIDGLLAQGPDATVPEGAAAVAGAVLDSFAGLERAANCNLMVLEIPFAVRAEIHEHALRLRQPHLADDWVAVPAWTGLEAALVETARGALRVLNDSVRLQTVLESGLAMLERDVAPDAPLQSWRFVFGLLRNPDTAVAAGTKDTALRVRGWIDFLRLGPPDVLLQLLRPSLEELLKTHPELTAISELRGLLAQRAWSPDEMAAAADAWYHAEPGHPGALLCRFKALVLQGKVFEASCCGAELLQRVGKQKIVLDEMVEGLRAAEQRGGDDAQRWSQVRAAFERYGG
jgi:serine/threonine protein kinase